MQSSESAPANASSAGTEHLPLAGLSGAGTARAIAIIAFSAAIGGAVMTLVDYLVFDRRGGLDDPTYRGAEWALGMFVLLVVSLLWIRRQSRRGRRSRLLDFWG